MIEWQNGHGAPGQGGASRRAAVSPQSFPIYDKAGFLHVFAVQGVSTAPRRGIQFGRGKRGI